MKSRHLITWMLLAVATLATPGCGIFGRKPKPPRTTPPAPQVTPMPQPQPPPVEEPKPAPPSTPTEQLPVTPPVTPHVEEKPAPTPQPPVTPIPTPRPSRPRPVPATPAPAPAPPPAFGEILSPAQQVELRQTYDRSARAAQHALQQLNGRKLDADQTATANRVRSFLKQAAEARATDPSTAARLAQRAELLAQNLLNSLQ